jgi:hypothetical protein
MMMHPNPTEKAFKTTIDELSQSMQIQKNDAIEHQRIADMATSRAEAYATMIKLLTDYLDQTGLPLKKI